YYVAGVYNASANTLDIYVNGVLDNGVLTGVVPSSQAVPALNPTIGKRAGGYYFKGIIDDVRVHNRALLGSGIHSNMKSAVTATPTGHSVLSSSATELESAGLKEMAGAAAHPRGMSLSCGPRTANAGSEVTCDLRTARATTGAIQLSSTSSRVRIPGVV